MDGFQLSLTHVPSMIPLKEKFSYPRLGPLSRAIASRKRPGRDDGPILRSLCHVLCDDGITYHEYVSGASRPLNCQGIATGHRTACAAPLRNICRPDGSALRPMEIVADENRKRMAQDLRTWRKREWAKSSPFQNVSRSICVQQLPVRLEPKERSVIAHRSN